MAKRATRTAVERARMLRRVERLYLRGGDQAGIAATLGISQQAVSHHEKKLARRWLRQATGSHANRLARDLAKLDALEQEYWIAWERSCGIRTRRMASRRQARTETTSECVIAMEMQGNPAYLAGVGRCIERRCKLLHLDDTDLRHVTVVKRFVNIVTD